MSNFKCQIKNKQFQLEIGNCPAGSFQPGSRNWREKFEIGNYRVGFTLIELILVITIMLIMGFLSAVFYSRFYTQNSVANVQDQLLGDLRKAQLYAMTSKKSNSSGWGVRYGSNTISLFQGANYAGKTYEETFIIPSSITISNFVEITFGRITGIPSSGNPSTSPTITITGSNGISKQIQVNAQGVASR